MKFKTPPHPSQLQSGTAPGTPGVQRRHWLQRLAASAGLPLRALWPLAAGAPLQALAQGAADTTGSDEPPRLALLLGNRDYPGGEDLPPIHKNVRDLGAALRRRGFVVSEGLDLSLEQARQAMAEFAARVRAAPPQCTALFYFSGHGAQVDAENLLVSARLNPKSRADVLARNSMAFTGDVMGLLPQRPGGLTITIIDACRTSLREVARGEGLNQVEAPPGTLIAFATGAGRPAIAPADDSRNTFYTASLVKLLEQSSGEISFSDLFRLVKLDVQQTMLNHPVALLRQFAQFPFIAENTRVNRRLSPARAASAAGRAPAEGAAAPAAPAVPASGAAVAAAAAADSAASAAESAAREAADWARLQSSVWPGDVLQAATDYLARYPQSPRAGSAVVAREGAREAAQILARNDVRLFRSAFQPAAVAAADPYAATPAPAAEPLAPDLLKAGRGDKDAAARVARSWGRQSGRWNSGRYEGWLQYAAALGNGIASYELALHYRRSDQPLLAAQMEERARDLGYTPPPSLDNSRK